MSSILVVDVGTSGVRAALIDGDRRSRHRRASRGGAARLPRPGLVEFDARHLADAAMEVAHAMVAGAGEVGAVGIANQRASTVVWDRTTGEPVGPAIGWQDLRTVGDCLVLQGEGVRLAPNQSATKVKWLLDQFDPDRSRDLLFGTVDSWLVWQLTDGAHHVTDLSNAAVTGMTRLDGSGWDPRVLEALAIPDRSLPTIVDSTGVVGEATALAGSPPIAGIAGDQQASLVGQGCVRTGLAQDHLRHRRHARRSCLDAQRPALRHAAARAARSPSCAGARTVWLTWGLEAIMLSAGTNVEWLRDDLGLISSVAESHDVASTVDGTEGVVYVPALLGLGTPHWDYGRAGTLLGLTRGSRPRPSVVRAVLEGVAQRGADLVEATEADADIDLASLRVDGGMSANTTFLRALADATGRPVEVSPVTEATTLGAALLAGLATDAWGGWDDVAATWRPSRVRRARARRSTASCGVRPSVEPAAGSPTSRDSTSSVPPPRSHPRAAASGNSGRSASAGRCHREESDI
ncbi:MAG: FGGY family carbohydrate kinase [Acidimicrobiia bacterium]|nr:FGGY family carbohydrate kinase [Acidimicrobiia bacterium]